MAKANATAKSRRQPQMRPPFTQAKNTSEPHISDRIHSSKFVIRVKKENKKKELGGFLFP